MPSPAQIAANRENAKLSTGPRTYEGKAISSMNNFKLGLACRTFAVLESEDQDEFDNYTRRLLAEYVPKTNIEYTLLYKIAQHHWLSQRAFVAEQVCFGELCMPQTTDDERRLALMLRYQAHHDRAFHKTRNELDKLIAARHQREKAAEPKKMPESKSVAPQPEPRRTGLNPLAPAAEHASAYPEPETSPEPAARPLPTFNAA